MSHEESFIPPSPEEVMVLECHQSALPRRSNIRFVLLPTTDDDAKARLGTAILDNRRVLLVEL